MRNSKTLPACRVHTEDDGDWNGLLIDSTGSQQPTGVAKDCGVSAGFAIGL